MQRWPWLSSREPVCRWEKPIWGLWRPPDGRCAKPHLEFAKTHLTDSLANQQPDPYMEAQRWQNSDCTIPSTWSAKEKCVTEREKNGVKINQVGAKAQSCVIVTVLSTRLNTPAALPNQKLSDLLSVYRRVIVLVRLLRHQGFTKQASGGAVVCADILLCYYGLMKKSLHLIWWCK